MLSAGRAEAKVRAWPGRPTTAQLVLFDHTVAPPAGVLREWLAHLADLGFDEIRTGALAASTARRFELAGFVPIQRLTLLQADLARVELGRVGTRRRDLRGGDVVIAAAIDQAAFGEEWGLDPAGIEDAETATPTHRTRLALDRHGEPSGYAITGRSRRRGFIQRLAVLPDHQREGLGRALVVDALRWLRRWHVETVMVNTHRDNLAALALYAALGFEPVDSELVVLARAG